MKSDVYNEKHELSSSVRVSEAFNLDDFVSIFIDDEEDIFQNSKLKTMNTSMMICCWMIKIFRKVVVALRN